MHSAGHLSIKIRAYLTNQLDGEPSDARARAWLQFVMRTSRIVVPTSTVINATRSLSWTPPPC